MAFIRRFHSSQSFRFWLTGERLDDPWWAAGVAWGMERMEKRPQRRWLDAPDLLLVKEQVGKVVLIRYPQIPITSDPADETRGRAAYVHAHGRRQLPDRARDKTRSDATIAAPGIEIRNLPGLLAYLRADNLSRNDDFHPAVLLASGRRAVVGDRHLLAKSLGGHAGIGQPLSDEIAANGIRALL